MTVRVDTLEAILTGSSSRTVPAVRLFSTALLERLTSWWHQRSTTMVMSAEWMSEYRSSHRDHD